jgi:hypothetical protein
VDLIIRTPKGQEYAVEIKSNNNPHPASLTGLKSFAEIKPKAKLVCACLAPKPRQVGNIHIVPWLELFDMLGLNVR